MCRKSRACVIYKNRGYQKCVKWSVELFYHLLTSFWLLWWKLDLSRLNNKKNRAVLRKCVMTHVSCQFWRISGHFCFSPPNSINSPYSKTPVCEFSSIYNGNYMPNLIFKDIIEFLLSKISFCTRWEKLILLREASSIMRDTPWANFF